MFLASRGFTYGCKVIYLKNLDGMTTLNDPY